MVAVDSAALAHVLDSVDLRVGIARRVALAPGGLLPLPAGAATLVYVASGTVVRGSSPAAMLTQGDAFLTLGGSTTVLDAVSPTDLVVVELELSSSTSMLALLLPDPITVTAFAALEPAAAALAGSMGPTDPPSWPGRQGDPVICRIMAKTVLLSVIRAWAAHGCAPEGWPAVSADPFLDRVVAAIHADPGRDWTVERLAGVGAMSRSVFAERFRTALGRSPVDYVTEVRVDAAKRMLGSGRSVSETSRELGYASDEGFSRAFRRRTGLTPSAWRAAQLTAVPA
nr:AraC family transcriptional regulator [uncultured Microbacterium sp.]